MARLPGAMTLGGGGAMPFHVYLAHALGGGPGGPGGPRGSLSPVPAPPVGAGERPQHLPEQLVMKKQRPPRKPLRNSKTQITPRQNKTPNVTKGGGSAPPGALTF